MFIDVGNAGWIPIYNLNLSDDVIGHTGSPAIALDYPWTYLISGHLGRAATREDVAMHQQYTADIEASSREALASVNPGPFFKHYGENVWAAVRAHLDAVTEHAAAPVIAKYTGRAGIPVQPSDPALWTAAVRSRTAAVQAGNHYFFLVPFFLSFLLFLPFLATSLTPFPAQRVNELLTDASTYH